MLRFATIDLQLVVRSSSIRPEVSREKGTPLRFWILGLGASRDVIATRIQSKKGCFSVWKMEWTALRSHHARFTRATSDKRTESGTNPRYMAQTVYLLGPEPQAALDRATPLYTALRDTVKKVVEFTAESITSVKSCEKHSNLAQNSVKATDIRTNATGVETRKNIVQ